MSKQISEQVKNREITPNQARMLRNQLFSGLGIEVAAFQGDIPGGDTFFEQFSFIPIEELSTQTVMDVWAMRGQNPEFVESVPGAPTAGDNSDAVLERMQSGKLPGLPPPAGTQAPPPPPPPPNGNQPPKSAAEVIDLKNWQRKGPHPIPIRKARLAPIHKRLVGQLRKHFAALKSSTRRALLGDAKSRDIRKQDDINPDVVPYDSRQAQEDLAVLIRAGVIDAAEAAYVAAGEDYGLGGVSWNEGNPWLERHMGKRLPLIQGIDDNLRQRIRQSLLDSAEDGDSMVDAAKDVMALFDDMMDSRAEMIARTELIQAYGSASLSAYKEAGVEQAEMYDGDNDDEANCAEVNGQIVTLAEADALMADEHPNGTRGVAPVVEMPQAIAARAPRRTIRKEAFYSQEPVPPEHDHSTEPGERPVITFDVHGTLTPSDGFTAPGRPGSMLPPFLGVKEGMDRLVAGGCCLHLNTAALSPYHPPELLQARKMLLKAYCTAYSLPISYTTGKVGAHIYVDDRMVPVQNGDWDAVMKRTVAKLNKRFTMGPDGIWRRKDIPEVGRPVQDFPDPTDVLPDRPRGLSTPIADLDLHRCVFKASSSKLESGLQPGALEAVRTIYDAGFQVYLSCAGWDPLTHSKAESGERLASLRRQARAAGVPYDEMVSKDHPDVAIDNKGYEFTNWATDLPILMAMLAQPHPEDEVTGVADRQMTG